MPKIYESNEDHLVAVDKDGEPDYPGPTGLDYIAETDKTASNVFSPENVGVIELTTVLAAVIHAAQEMDKFKKALFRKRTREESNLGAFVPGEVTLTQALSRFDEPYDGKYDNLFHGIIGSITEVGEMAEILMALLDMETPPDQTNVREEIGDVLWYLSRLVKYADTTFMTEMQRNIDKLRQRHGQGGFNKDADITRDLDAERATLEGQAPPGQYSQDVAAGMETVGTVTGDPHSEDDPVEV